MIADLVKKKKKKKNTINLLSHFQNSETFISKETKGFLQHTGPIHSKGVHEVIPKSSFRTFPSHFYQSYHKCNAYTDSNRNYTYILQDYLLVRSMSQISQF